VGTELLEHLSCWGRCGRRDKAGTLWRQSCWKARVAGDAVDIGIKWGRCGDRFAATLPRVAGDAVDVGVKGGHSGDRVAGTLEPLGNCWSARVAWDAVYIRRKKRGHCGDRVGGTLELLGTLWAYG
jgi:hypothetical protein